MVLGQEIGKFHFPISWPGKCNTLLPPLRGGGRKFISKGYALRNKFPKGAEPPWHGNKISKEEYFAKKGLRPFFAKYSDAIIFLRKIIAGG